MKVGILTYHRAENYGALLQAFALKAYLQGKVQSVGFVDYWPEYHKDYFRIFPVKRFMSGGVLSKFRCFYLAIVWGFSRLRKKKKLNAFMCSQLGLNGEAKYNDEKEVISEFDLVFFGSDQIWRKQKLPGFSGMDLRYLGAGIQARKVAYAASMGKNKLTETERGTMKVLLEEFESVSVRESSLQAELRSMGISSTLVTDPVFLIEKERWKELACLGNSCRIKKGGYILYYNLLGATESTCFAEKLKQKTHLPIVEITKEYSLMHLGKRYVRSASVPEFLAMIENADFVVSNSFHGVALSIVFEKQFYAVGMGERADRVVSLLRQLGLEGRYSQDGHFSDELIGYDDSFRLRLAEYVRDSKKYLDDALRYSA